MTTMNSSGDITTTKGDTFLIPFTNVQSGGSDIDFTGYTARFMVRTSPKESSPVLSLDETNGIDLSVAGQITITAPPASMNMVPRSYVYDLEITDDSGVVQTWFNNRKFTVTDEVAW